MSSGQMVDAIVQIGTGISALVVFALGLALTATIAKALGIKEVQVRGVKLSTDQLWIIFAVLTFVHMFLTWLVLRTVAAFLLCSDAAQAAQVWASLTNELSGRLVFFQMVERGRAEGWAMLEQVPISTVKPSDYLDDPALVVQSAAAVLLVTAIVRVFGARNWVRLGTVVVALTILFVNVVFVSFWALAVSDVSRKSNGVEQTAIRQADYRIVLPGKSARCTN